MMNIEIRADKKSMAVRGYVNVVARDSRVLHDKTGPYIEQITPGAFGKALRNGGTVELRFDHERTLGSTEDGNLELREDNIGLMAEAEVTDEAVIAAAEKKELRGWSFGFVKKKDHWKTDEDGTRRRYVDEMELREVSILDKTPAYIATSIETRDGDEVLIECRMEDLEPDVQYQSETKEQVHRETHTMTPGEEAIMQMVDATVRFYKVKRRT